MALQNRLDPLPFLILSSSASGATAAPPAASAEAPPAELPDTDYRPNHDPRFRAGHYERNLARLETVRKVAARRGASGDGVGTPTGAGRTAGSADAAGASPWVGSFTDGSFHNAMALSSNAPGTRDENGAG